MLSLEEATRRILSEISPLSPETITVSQALRRISAVDLAAPVNLPTFDNSAMDGYAVLASDLVDANVERAIPLRLTGEMAAGSSADFEVTNGTCVRVFTGSPMPTGADAVVMQEDTQREERSDEILFLDAVKPWENVRFAGEDIRAGTKIISAGEQLGAGLISVASACGLAEISVGRKPIVGLLATGDELVEPGNELQRGQIYESNRTQLMQLVDLAGGIPKPYPIVPDQLNATCDALAEAMIECDVIVTSGAVSVGDHDHVRPAIEKLGGKLEFWRVAVRPGKPFVHGTVKGKQFFGLPGNPVSTFVTFLLLVRPALIRMQGGAKTVLPSANGTLREQVFNRGNRRHFARVILDEQGGVSLSGLQSSHGLSSLIGTNGLVDVPPETEWESGRKVDVLLIEG